MSTKHRTLPALEEDYQVLSDTVREFADEVVAPVSAELDAQHEFPYEIVAQMGEMGGFDAVALQKYHWVESINHVHHAGNSSGIVDGAALLLVGNERVGQEMGLTPRARIVSTAVIGSEPTIMLTGPAPSCRKALDRVGMKASDIDLVEINEAFAAVALKLMRDMGWSEEQTNVNGGAIAMGHPLGATGAMILGTLVDELERRDLERGISTLCIGGGMGVALTVER